MKHRRPRVTLPLSAGALAGLLLTVGLALVLGFLELLGSAS